MTFDEASAHDDIVVLRDIRIESRCEHHIMAILGKVHVAYRPAGRVVGTSKLARVVEVFAERLQNQEALTMRIAECINDALAPHGVAVVVEAVHLCMTTGGIEKHEVNMITRRFLRAFHEDGAPRRELLTMNLRRAGECPASEPCRGHADHGNLSYSPPDIRSAVEKPGRGGKGRGKDAPSRRWL